MGPDDAQVEVHRPRLERAPPRAREQDRDPFGPFTTHSAARICPRSILAAAAILWTNSSFDRAGAQERRGGERETRVCAAHRDQAGRALLHDRVVPLGPSAGEREPGVQVPSVGCPANGSSDRRGEDAHQVIASESTGGSTKVVSERFVQRAKRCICSVVRSLPSSTTATGLPAYAAS